MRRRWLSLLFCLQVCLCALAVSSLAQSTSQLRVNEGETRILLAAGQSKISLAVENIAGFPTLAQIKLELLDPQDKVVASTHRRETLKPGASSVAAFLPVSNLAHTDGENYKQLLWYRLRYDIRAVGADAIKLADSSPHQGIISLSEITPDLFELRVSAASKAQAGQLYRVRVRATHPLTSRPVRGVEVAAQVVFDETNEDGKSGALKLSGTTGSNGYVSLDFNLPARLEMDEGEIKVTARRGDIIQTASDDISLDRTTRILLTSDKPLYQPGQILHLRALLLNHATRRALAFTEATLKIEDPEGTTVFTAPLKTSRFGIASCDWPIPDNTRLGDYSVRVEPNDTDADESAAYLRLRISRYELPNFSVSATADRGYYLPGESAQVEVRGDYLFGQPLKRGHVRLVRETEREWNYKEQKYDIREGDKHEGELGSDGRFLARINLSKEHEELSANSWRRFTDLNYAAYVTDPTTNRTEQRRFRLRLTKEPIHIYVTTDNYPQSVGLPLVFFVSTSYADGTPAACEVKLAHTPTERRGGQVPRTIRTNAYGIAKVFGTKLDGNEDGDFSILLSAHDREGRTGQHIENFSLASGPVIRIETDKTIYRAGESVTARISANVEDLRIFVDVVSNNRVVATETLSLRGGNASLELPYRPEFQNRVTLSAYSADIPDSDDDDYPKGLRTVVFPRNRELKFDVRMSRASYQPGEEASAGVRVRNAAGRSVESALGVVVFDKAVEERARTEQDFGASYGFSDYFHQFWYGQESIGGVSARDIEQLNFARTLPEGLDTVAELLLQRDDENYHPNFFGSSDGGENQSEVFAALASAQLKAASDALSACREKNNKCPANEAELRRLLADAKIALEDLRDPWGTRYQPVFSIERDTDVLYFMSAGADKLHGTEDDWRAGRFTWPYFAPEGAAINRALNEYHKRTGNFIRDFATLKSELARANFDLDTLRDRWGKPYSFNFGVVGSQYILNVVSGGPNGRLESAELNYRSDDFAVWTVWMDYFLQTRTLIDTVLNAHLAASGNFPRDEAALRALLRRAQLDETNFRDPWHRPYYATFRTEARYTGHARIESGASGDRTQAAQGMKSAPVSYQFEFIALRTAGVDGKPGTEDDFTVAEFSHVVNDQAARDVGPSPAPAVNNFSGATGAIGGIVTDPSGAAVAGAIVTATHQQVAERVFAAATGEDGRFLLRDLPAGLYTLTVDMSGFTRTIMSGAKVQSATLTTANFTLNVANISEAVMVTAEASTLVQTSSSKIQSSITKGRLEMLGRGESATKPPISTPRLRKDFPETLYWQPAVETDAQGRTDIRFKLADNITTWKMSIIGSTETGELGTFEQEIRAFQPFFVEHDPPRVLTEGDEISLPVVLRNYLDRPQPVSLDIKPEDWFTLLGPARKQSNVAAGDATRETFDFRAVASVKEGMQRITATATDASDQIEKPIHVHPDGEEVAETSTQLLREASLLEVNLPAAMIQRSARSELKIYPNLLAHAIEGVEAIMSRPYGCAEQTISSTYPSLLVLRHYQRTGSIAGDTGATAKPLPPVAMKAARYVRQGYERLLSYRSDSGGFSYWGRGEPDLALTAYAVRFLTDAREFTNVDESVLMKAREWLTRQQRENGSWAAYEWDKNENKHRSALLTAYVARILAMQQPDAKIQPDAQGKIQSAPPAASRATPLRRALTYLAPLVEEIDEPYLIASYALAAIDGGESPDAVARATARLRALARDEAGGSYWSLESSTPFYGWGQAGRIETTALAVQALSRAKTEGREPQDEQGRARDEKKTDSTPASKSQASALTSNELTSEELVDRGLLFLLKNKDRYGVWLSTQATVNVLDALDALSTKRTAEVQSNKHAADAQSNKASAASSASSPSSSSTSLASSIVTGAGGQRAEVFVNGQSAGVVVLPAAHEAVNPVSLDLSRFLVQGDNRVEIRRAPGSSPIASAQIVTTYYRAWANAGVSRAQVVQQDARALRLTVNFDRTTAATGDTVTCNVEAERIGNGGYGMLLAEVGLPPGADVDRASLERAMKESGWQFSHYDVLPDRLVAYLWPRAGGTKFTFNFRPRFGLAAKTAPSLVYDYYNPEARTVLAPTKFVVSDKPAVSSATTGRE